MNVIKRKHAVVALVCTMMVLLLLTACADSSVKEDTHNEETFFPMQAGSEMVFSVEGSVESKTTTIKMLQQFSAFGVDWYSIEPLLGEAHMIRNTPDGVVYAADCGPYDFQECVNEFEQLEEHILYKYPASRGERYGVFGWGDDAVTVLGEQELTVPAGTFRCMLYQFDLGELTSRHCVAPGTGLVWVQETWPTRDGQIPVVLKRVND